MVQLKVKNNSNVKSVASAIAGNFKNGEKEVEIIVVGGGSMNQAVKAIAVARGFLAPIGIEIVAIPSFLDVKIDNKDFTGMCLKIEKK